ncbi:hypothetical protein YC2023_075263 [Brassica napus]
MVRKGMRVGKYELGRTLGEGNSAKVKLATDTVSGQSFAVKIIDKSSIKRLNVSFQEDGLLHTTCGSPNYVAPEVLANKGYDGAASDIWSCGVILYVILTGCLPFDDANLAIFKGDPPIPRWLSPGAKTMIKRMLDPNPITRMTIAGIKANDWFNNGYTPSNSDDEDDASSIQEDMVKVSEEEKNHDSPIVINAFELIGMSSFLDLSGLFETEKVSDRQIRFTSNRLAIDVLEKIKTNLMEMGFYVQKKQTMLKAIQQESNRKGQSGLSLTAEVFGIVPLLNVVELRKTHVVRQIIQRIGHIIASSIAFKVVSSKNKCRPFEV